MNKEILLEGKNKDKDGKKGIALPSNPEKKPKTPPPPPPPKK